TLLDWELIEVTHRVTISPPALPVEALPRKTGLDVSVELGGRYLLRYLLRDQVGRYANGSTARHYVTPTPYAPQETPAYLALPEPARPREYVMLLDPRQIHYIWGPQWIRGAPGVQYVLLEGFPQRAVVVSGTPGASWEIPVR